MVLKKVPALTIGNEETEGCYIKVAKTLAKSNRCIVVTGAGISCSAGIPDFRSSTGLYNIIKTRQANTMVRGKDMFDANLFRSPETTDFFYRFMGELKDMITNCKFTKTHSFIKHLRDHKKLLRCYTQNIDDLEVKAKLKTNLNSDPKDVQVVQLHGTMSRVVCTLSPAQHAFEFSSEYVSGFKTGEPPNCPKCVESQKERILLGKRHASLGFLRPDIVLYNEPNHRDEMIGSLQCHDLRKRPDFLLVMGTSLKVPGCKRLVKEAAKAVHSIKGGIVVFVNLSDVSLSEWDNVIDYHFQCPTDSWVSKIEPLFLKQLKPKSLPLSKSYCIPRSEKDIMSESVSPFPDSPSSVALDNIFESSIIHSPGLRRTSGFSTKFQTPTQSPMARYHTAISFKSTEFGGLYGLDQEIACELDDQVAYPIDRGDPSFPSCPESIASDLDFDINQGTETDSTDSLDLSTGKEHFEYKSTKNLDTITSTKSDNALKHSNASNNNSKYSSRAFRASKASKILHKSQVTSSRIRLSRKAKENNPYGNSSSVTPSTPTQTKPDNKLGVTIKTKNKPPKVATSKPIYSKTVKSVKASARSQEAKYERTSKGRTSSQVQAHLESTNFSLKRKRSRS